MSNYLVINLADRTEMGAIGSLKDGVRAKRTRTGVSALFGQNNIEYFNAFPLLDADVLGQLVRSDLQVTALRQKCLKSKKIYLATHGIPTDVDHAFAGAAGGKPLCTVQQLANFLLLILPMRKDEYNMALVMCYGARTANFRSTALNHQGMIPFNDLRTSFAYKLYSRVARMRRMRMTARTGAVSFDSHTGVSKVEDELSIDARIDKEIFLRRPEIIPGTHAFKQARNLAASNGTPALAEFDRLKTSFEQDPHKLANTAEEIIIKNYTNILRTKQQYSDIMDAHPDSAKYGKLVYTYQNSILTISSSYANNGGRLTLYQGSMV